MYIQGLLQSPKFWKIILVEYVFYSQNITILFFVLNFFKQYYANTIIGLYIPCLFYYLYPRLLYLEMDTAYTLITPSEIQNLIPTKLQAAYSIFCNSNILVTNYLCYPQSFTVCNSCILNIVIPADLATSKASKSKIKLDGLYTIYFIFYIFCSLFLCVS